MFFLSFHTKVKVVEFSGDLQNADLWNALPKNLGKMLPPSPHQLRAAYKAAQRFQEQILSPLLDPRINISLDLPNG